MKATAQTSPPTTDEILSWAEVNRTHRIRNGVYQRGGRLISLLTDFGRINPCYPDEAQPDGEAILYTGEGRRGDQHLSPGNRALLAAVESGHGVPLFNKLAPGHWQHMGFWRVVAAEHRFDEIENRMLWRFTLKKAPPSRSRRS
ncbi:MAG: hypothetical protein H0W76_18120 [Pyrinomonadaceae bacterium]|nr:hypothetical protein [Pyrinomonadaceae bacterium]